MKISVAILLLALAAAGCAGKSKAQLREQNAYLAGQIAALRRQQAQAAAQFDGVTVVGSVLHSQVPWVVGLTLTQAIATANYVGPDAPKQIIIIRHGESATMDADVLVGGAEVPLEEGDIIQLR
jgi:hypothetical protein